MNTQKFEPLTNDWTVTKTYQTTKIDGKNSSTIGFIYPTQ